MQFEILVDRSEKVQKCTILPLEYRKDFRIVRFPRGVPLPPLDGDLLLHPDGEALDTLAPKLKVDHPVTMLSSIDCVWKRLPNILRWVGTPLPRLAGIPKGFVTAYPRRNKENLDPEGGLATIEALFIAAAFLGTWDETLLAEYHWGAEFLALNGRTFAAFGLGQGRV